jgi:hypothetical protein
MEHKFMMQVWRTIASLSPVMCCMTFILLLPAGLSAISTSACSHELRPAIADFSSNDNGEYELALKFNLESWLARIGSNHSDTTDSPNSIEYNRMRGLSGEELRQLLVPRVSELENTVTLVFDGNNHSPEFSSSQIPPVGDIDLARDSIIHFRGKIPAGVTSLVWRFQPAASVFRITGVEAKPNNREREKIAVYVKAGEASRPIAILAPVEPGFISNLAKYITVGFDHIVPKGLDHILFVVGLFLLSTHWSPLIWQVSAFTLAHSVTLGLGMAGFISLPANIVEPLIAASIVYIAIENLFTDRLSFWRPIVVFLFGLLHGLGFAGVLGEFGLGKSNFLSGLVGFNIGVELGQLSVIAGCYLLVGYWFGNKTWYHDRVTVPGSLLIGAIGSWWFYQRVLLA